MRLTSNAYPQWEWECDSQVTGGGGGGGGGGVGVTSNVWRIGDVPHFWRSNFEQVQNFGLKFESDADFWGAIWSRS